MKGESIWITGASSGIGRELAIQLAARGARVIASGRNTEALAELCCEHSGITPLSCDVTDKEAMASLAEALAEAGGGHLDRVVLNAGTCEYLDISDPDWDMLSRVMEINYRGMVNSVAVALPLLRKASHPHLVGVSSQAINAPFVRSEAYGASKAAVSYFLRSLRLDLAADGIDVTEIQPGFVDTPLTRKNDFSMPFLMSPEDAVRRIMTALEKRSLCCAFPRRLSAALWLIRQLPGWWLKKQSSGKNNKMQNKEHRV